ncbi:hypothetical protein A6302_02636 [Methylobrevis pamukkalensis]|uniref:MotA/TolQ/ExbB proton channel family protein n=1 Tax=Methylobrevis pamukkalensis TaxID=1439726 RepID=A0A1E3H145_9HYPH|nr:hypothetical protein A6302_02636 [Methylobrevis pamukkalensis]
MVKDIDPYKLSSPQVYLWRMVLFLVIASLIAMLLYRQIQVAFLSNPALNSTIILCALIGILLAIRQVMRLVPEVRWVNSFRLGDPGLMVARPPVLLAPMATLLGDRLGRTAISTQTMRSILDSIGTRLDEARDISRYLTGLLVFLGLLGTFWGLIETVTAVGDTIQSLDVTSGNSGAIFEDLKAGLQAPLSGMGTAFSSSLFGLAGSLILGFLDLQAAQAQNRFYVDLEDWLSTVTDLEPEELDRHGAGGFDDVRVALERLTREIHDGGSRGTSAAMASLAESSRGSCSTCAASRRPCASGPRTRAASRRRSAGCWRP